MPGRGLNSRRIQDCCARSAVVQHKRHVGRGAGNNVLEGPPVREIQQRHADNIWPRSGGRNLVGHTLQLLNRVTPVELAEGRRLISLLTRSKGFVLLRLGPVRLWERGEREQGPGPLGGCSERAPVGSDRAGRPDNDLSPYYLDNADGSELKPPQSAGLVASRRGGCRPSPRRQRLETGSRARSGRDQCTATRTGASVPRSRWR